MAKLDEQDLIRMGLQTALFSAKSIKWYRGHLKKPLANAKKIYKFRDWTPQIEQAKAFTVKTADSVSAKAGAKIAEIKSKPNREYIQTVEHVLDSGAVPETKSIVDNGTVSEGKSSTGIGKTAGIAAASAAVVGAAALGTWQVLKKSH